MLQPCKTSLSTASFRLQQVCSFNRLDIRVDQSDGQRPGTGHQLVLGRGRCPAGHPRPEELQKLGSEVSDSLARQFKAMKHDNWSALNLTTQCLSSQSLLGNANIPVGPATAKLSIHVQPRYTSTQAETGKPALSVQHFGPDGC